MKIVFFTGAGVSAESGISTFRDSDGLWENYNIEDVASINGWRRNKELVLNFYNERRRQLQNVSPNSAHEYIANLENNPELEVVVITQNVDNLHERAGSSNVIHLHGKLNEGCSSTNKKTCIVEVNGDINIGDLASDGSQLRPNIVWFGEYVDMDLAYSHSVEADLLVVIGTSLQVEPAASLVDDARCNVVVIDPNDINRYGTNFTHIKKNATEGVLDLDEFII